MWKTVKRIKMERKRKVSELFNGISNFDSPSDYQFSSNPNFRAILIKIYLKLNFLPALN